MKNTLDLSKIREKNMSNERTEQIKKILMSAQQCNTPEEQLANDIAEGKVHLLSAQEICERLRLSAEEFTILVRNSDPTYSPTSKNKMQALTHLVNENTLKVMKLDPQYQYSFPAPDLYIAGKARWTKDTLKKWLLQGAE
ncbi:hypothetical protein [Actinobacillus porcinus]|uniref:hypothetical protein n=1 Tax=Actinobacillus porcinus TaxID=51048 RepID=UPI0023540B2B|nr:hypothetical protein [Actinobacillus porcinus]